MTNADNYFAQKYRNKSAQELARLAAEEGNLVPEARQALRIEIARRSSSDQQASAAKTPATAGVAVPAKDSLEGVEGWLFVYALGLILVAIRVAVNASLAIALKAGLPLVIAIFLFGAAVWNMATAVAIFYRARFALSMVADQLLMMANLAVFSLGVRIALVFVSKESADAGILILESSLLGAETFIWYRYFCTSKRVFMTFGRNL